jgi:hypothetical protein
VSRNNDLACGGTLIPVIESDMTHSVDYPFCDLTLHPDCPCREDQENITAVNEMVQDGLLTPEEATRYVQGKMI